MEFSIAEQQAGHSNTGNYGTRVTVSANKIYNQWFHFTGVFSSGSGLKLYIDGNLVDQVSTTLNGYTNHDVSLLIGAGESDGVKTWSWDGKLDDIFIYDKL